MMPCPFCGESARVEQVGGMQAICDGCGARSGVWTTTAAAIKAWDRRIDEDESTTKILDAVDAVLESQGVNAKHQRMKAGGRE